MDKIIDEIQAVVRKVFNNEKLEVIVSTRFDQLDDWDSFKKVEIILAIEEIWGVQLTPDQIDRVSSVQDLLNIRGDIDAKEIKK